MTDGIASMIGEIKNAHVEVDLDADPEDDFDIVNATTNETFDPAIHVSDKEGNPVLTKTGKFRFKPGRKSGQSRTSGINIPQTDAADEDEEKIRLAAQTAAAIYINTGVVTFGPEWLPDRAANEQEGLSEAFYQYLKAKGITDIPPGLALAIALSGYAAKRMYMPQTQTKMQRFILWVKLKLGRAKLHATRNDFGANRVRENDAGETDGKASGWFRRARSRS